LRRRPNRTPVSLWSGQSLVSKPLRLEKRIALFEFVARHANGFEEPRELSS
jgi:hypothetical protein